MNEITVLLVVATMAFYALTWFVKRQEPNWMAFFMSICAIGGILTDETMSETASILFVLPLFYIMAMSGLASWGGMSRK